MTDLLRARGIAMSLAGRRVLTSVDLDVRPGEVLGLVGANGAGKTTLMNVLSGRYQPDAGSMSYDGEPYHPSSVSDARDMGIGIIEQNFSIDPELTVAQAIFRNTYQHDRPHASLRRQAQWLLNDAGVHLSPDVRIGDLVRPEIGLVEAVRLLADDAQIVLVDEVASTFNVREIQDLHFITSRLTRQGRSVIYVSHRLQEVRDISHRVAVLRDGRIEGTYKSSAISNNELAEKMFGKALTDGRRRTSPTAEVVLRANSLEHGLLSGTEFTLHRGEVIALVGPRRSGIADLVGAITGDRPANNALEVFGQSRLIRSPQDAAALRISYFSDDDSELGLSRKDSIARSLMAGGWNSGTEFESEVAGIRRILDVLDQFRIQAQTMFANVETLSGGDQQKIALLRFLAEDADILILNEPTRAIDAQSRQDVYRMLSDVTAAGKSAILVTTDYSEAVAWADRILVFRGGQVWRNVRAADTNAEQLTLWARETAQAPRRVALDAESEAIAAELTAQFDADEAKLQKEEQKLDQQLTRRTSRAPA